MLTMSVNEYKTFSGHSPNKPRESKGRKYKNKPVYVYEDDFISTERSEEHGKLIQRFDSKKEYERYCELRLLERAGKISELKTQVSLMIQEACVSENDEYIKPITYKADFTYIENGVQVVEDVKALDKRTGKYLTTETFRIKWKLLKAKYPKYKFVIY